METRFSRTVALIGEDAVAKLKNSRVAVFGVGGVGGYIVEALVRSGVGTIDVIDNDVVNETNINRQIIATTKTVGRDKTSVIAQRAREINPDVVINERKVFFLPETKAQFDFSVYDHIADAIDTVSGKIELAVAADEAGVPIVSAMGAGNKLHPELFEVADIYETSVCPLAKVMRKELKKRGVKSLKVVYSKEDPMPSAVDETGRTPASISFVPPVVGLIMAGVIIRRLAGLDK